ncbi:MAG: PKD domain-containing protein [Candidatus Cloacimonadaceae bacterium]|nr:PKD domain-containing protein [Candidatus Cloacimonadota bacterium]MDY0128127.1 PKD domain-containing protein [Candidatus Cloacimonadaceae bacterium]MCB5254317.1 PKD domain-containing protein [Candidatus Cloacimonadota bacterium]MCK9178497.1 PKD domain-containing protein [Candidatus Cloacimonadota bacterium]MCK9243159.1 PKD domain-containing protein [Candidatus Cloacimonadota bacterium]
MKKNVILLAFLLCILALWGQNTLSEYSFSYSVNPYIEITEGTLLGNESTDDQFFVNPSNPAGGYTTIGAGFPIGFDFLFAGHSFDKVGINANGWLALGDSSFGSNAINMSSQSIHSPLASQTDDHPNEILIARIAGFGRDLQAQTGSSIRITQQGAAPDRELIVQWKHYRRQGATEDSYNFQVCLKEQGMKVCIRYQLMQTGNPCTGEIGLRAAPAATAVNFANRTTLGGWANSQPGTSANSPAALTSTNYPANGASFCWSPVLEAGGQANFTANITSGAAPLTVQFTDLSLAGTNPISSWLWDFGGHTSSQQHPLYCFNDPGLYTVSLTISDALGNSSTQTRQNYIEVSPSIVPGLNTYIQMQGNDAVISWDPINVDENGFTPQYYFLYFNGCSTASEQFYFLAPIPYPQTTYTHAGVGLGASHMMYRVKAVRLDY